VSADRVPDLGLLLGDYFAREGWPARAPSCLALTILAATCATRVASWSRPTTTPRSGGGADDDGYPFLDTVNEVISVLLRRLARAQRTRLVLPNPT